MIIFLHGEDSFRSNQKMLEIKNKFLGTEAGISGLSVIDCEDKNQDKNIVSLLGTPNLLAPKRLVIVKNLILKGSEKEQEDILGFLKKNKSLPEDKDLVVVFLEGGAVKKSHLIYKFLEKYARSQNFEKLSGMKIGQWILKRIKEVDEKAGISKQALEKLIIFCGDDTRILNNEIQKLANHSAGQMISEKDVEKLVKANLDENIFNTVDALGNNNKKEALRLFHRHLQSGEDPFYLFSMFVYQFRNLLKVADLKENQGFNEGEIARVSKLHPYVVKKSLNQIRNFSFEKLQKIYQKLSDLDQKSKLGKIEIKLALDKFIVEL